MKQQNPIKLSKASKIPCKSFSLQAGAHCKGMVDAKGKVKAVCSDCYALKGMYRFPVVKASRQHNFDNLNHPNWVPTMIGLVINEPYFRWFDSGDFVSVQMVENVAQVIRSTPNTRHWIPTKLDSNINSKYLPIHNAIKSLLVDLPNCTVRFSSPSNNGEYDAEHGSTVIPEKLVDTFKDDCPDISICPSKAQDGKCLDCRKCWDRSIPVIAYIRH